jgi:hypothetical protein
MIELNMTGTNKALYIKYENELLAKVESGILTMCEAAVLLDTYLKGLGY